MLIVYILLFGIVWLVLGDVAAFSLVGDKTFYYPDSCFGPLNAYKNSKFGDFDDKKEKRNIRLKIYLTLGGPLSILFMIIYFICGYIINFFRILKFAFSKDEK